MIQYTPARPADLAAIAELYQQAFPEALETVFGQPHLPSAAVEDVMGLLYACEPGGFLLATDPDRAVGFIAVSSDIRRLQGYLAIHSICLLGRALIGRYRGLGTDFIPNLWHAWRDYRAGDDRPITGRPLAQVLSIAVGASFRGQGVGKELSVRALAYLRSTRARKVRLEVDAAKPIPVALYHQLGFTDHATIRSPRGLARVMTLALKP